jgi:hypothetical protein
MQADIGYKWTVPTKHPCMLAPTRSCGSSPGAIAYDPAKGTITVRAQNYFVAIPNK